MYDMNKILRIFLAILGGIETTFYIFTPIIIAAIWISIDFGIGGWSSNLIFGIGLLSTLFRAIKIGFLK
jgi:hypothetical protein